MMAYYNHAHALMVFGPDHFKRPEIDPELLALAKKAAEACEKRNREWAEDPTKVEAWAKQLAEDFVACGESEYLRPEIPKCEQPM